MTQGYTTAPADALDFAIAGSNDHVYVWYADGTASSGTSRRLDAYRTPYPFSLPPGKKASDVRGIGIAGSNDHVYVWYSDGTVSSGTSRDFDAYRAPYPYSLPPGKNSNQIVAMAIAGSNDHVYAWYSDGTVSSGTSGDLDAYRAPYPFTLPPGRSVTDIVGMGIAGSNDHVYAWYRDGTVSSGTSGNLDAYRAPYRYQQHLVLKASWGPRVRRYVPLRDDPLDNARDDIHHELGVSFPGSDRDAMTLSKLPGDIFKLPPHVSDQSPPPVGQPFKPNIQGVDPMVAVGRNYVLVSQQGAVQFLDRSGNTLPVKNSIGPAVSGNQLFAAFLDPASPTNINHFVGFPQACDGPAYPQDVRGGRGFCIWESYDLRVYFDAAGDRFIVIGHMRNYIWTECFTKSFTNGQACGIWQNAANDKIPITWSGDPGNWCRLARRHVAIAVSMTEDPRDGFHLYALTENNYRDFPWATTNGDLLVIANRGSKMPDGPVATVLSLSAMRSGAPRVPYFRYYRQDLGGHHVRVLLPVHHGSPGGLTLMYATGSGEIRVYGSHPRRSRTRSRPSSPCWSTPTRCFPPSTGTITFTSLRTPIRDSRRTQ